MADKERSFVAVISQKAINNFCAGCDHLKTDGMCEVSGIDSIDQARYAYGKWCGYAKVGGKAFDKTSGGFQLRRLG